jgi:lysyl endopeptidase
VSAWTEGPNIDTVGAILDANGAWLESNDDATADSNHFGVTRALAAGRYYVQVGHWEPDGTGTYNLRIRADRVDAVNYTDLWSDPSENGWGININHQGNTLFATLYTYDANGAPMWLVMSNGDRQPDGSFQGPLYRGTGPAFNAQPWGATALTSVGSMRIAFTGSKTATLTYTVGGTQVTKAISRFEYASPSSCKWSAFDRAYTFNFQDLWLSPSEPGWGVNLAQQGTVVFATLFTYDRGGRDLWLVMSQGDQTAAGGFTGTLYRTSGPAFNASPWVPAQATAVGTMGFSFTDGNHGVLTYTYDGTTVTKQIQRYVFGAVRPSCES